MSKRAVVVAEEQEMRPSPAPAGDAMEKRRRLADLIRARMAQPATTMELKLWQEFKSVT